MCTLQQSLSLLVKRASCVQVCIDRCTAQDPLDSSSSYLQTGGSYRYYSTLFVRFVQATPILGLTFLVSLVFIIHVDPKNDSMETDAAEVGAEHPRNPVPRCGNAYRTTALAWSLILVQYIHQYIQYIAVTPRIQSWVKPKHRNQVRTGGDIYHVTACW